MFLVFVRHGGVAALLLGVAVEMLLWLSGAVALRCTRSSDSFIISLKR